MNETFVESEYKSFFDSIQSFQSQIQKLDTVVHKDIHTIELEKERAEQFLNEERIINFSKDQLILLNVGGKYFTTYHKTLTNYPSLLKAMFSGRIELYPLEDGSYFIDRDPDLFSYVLSYLRHGEVIWPTDTKKIKEVIEELDFFNIRHSKTQISYNQVFKYSSDFDLCGFFYWLGTNKGNEPFLNAMKRGLVELISLSGYYKIDQSLTNVYDTPSDLSIPFDYPTTNPVQCLTSNTTNTFFEIVLKTGKFKPNVICLSDSYSPETYLYGFGGAFKLEGCNESSAYVNIPVVEKSRGTKTLTLSVEANSFYSKFKLIKTSLQLLLSGIEFYGEYME